MYHLSCIKCGTQYDTEDPDPYYCETCKAEHLRVAAELDKKFPSSIRPKTPSELDIFLGEGRTMDKPDGSQITFVRTKL